MLTKSTFLMFILSVTWRHFSLSLSMCPLWYNNNYTESGSLCEMYKKCLLLSNDWKIPSTYKWGKARNFHYTLNSLVLFRIFLLLHLWKWKCEEEKLKVLALWINSFLQTNYILPLWLASSFFFQRYFIFKYATE